jgi:hypothetical protein
MRSGSSLLSLSTDWLKSKNPACAAVKREAEEDWGRDCAEDFPILIPPRVVPAFAGPNRHSAGNWKYRVFRYFETHRECDAASGGGHRVVRRLRANKDDLVPCAPISVGLIGRKSHARWRGRERDWADQTKLTVCMRAV